MFHAQYVPQIEAKVLFRTKSRRPDKFLNMGTHTVGSMIRRAGVPKLWSIQS
jgi:hypothetical protein